MMTDPNTDIIDNCLSLNVSNKFQERYIWCMQYTIKSFDFELKVQDYPCSKNDQHHKAWSMPIYYQFRSTSDGTSFRNFFYLKNWNFRSSLLSYFWAITLIFAVIAILEPFGTLAPRISVTVISKISKKARHNDKLEKTCIMNDFIRLYSLNLEVKIDNLWSVKHRPEYPP